MEENDSDEDEDIVFAKAKEFLQIVQSRTNIVEQETLATVQTQPNNTKRKMVQFGVPKTKKLKTVKSDSNAITPSQRKKLERVKTPVTSFRRPPTQSLSENEKEESVKKMLEHIRRMPEQEKYFPPLLPMVFINKTADEDAPVITQTSSQTDRVEFSYLTSEQELAMWKLLKSSPTNCNVFVGNLSYRVDENLLSTAFHPFIVEQQQRKLKARIVTDSLSGASKGYGFVQFPYRRAAELALICMQGFELFGREMQLGWGEEVVNSVSQPEKYSVKVHTTNKNKFGLVISDSSRDPTPNLSVCKKNRKSRWDVEASSRILSDHLNVSQSNEIQVNDKKKIEEGPEDDCLVETPIPVACSSSKMQFTCNLKLIDKEKILCQKTSTIERIGEEDRINEKLSFEHKTITENGSPKELNTELQEDKLVDQDVMSGRQQGENLVERRKVSDRPMEWLTKQQRAKMIEAVCQNLRKNGVNHHLGVFGTHFEADNSRLFLTCGKELTVETLRNEFEKYGSVQININKDISGLSKGSAIVQYVTSTSAETASKQLHGKVLGSKPLTIKIAEPKRTPKVDQTPDRVLKLRKAEQNLNFK